MLKCLIVAIADNYGIGVKGELPWHISEDLKYFKEVTRGYPVIMGRTTYFSLPFRPLKGRRNIVLNLGGEPIPEVSCVYSFEEAYREAEATGKDKCFIMGGASVYRAAMPEMDRLYITHVHTEVKDADALVFVVAHDVFKNFDVASLCSKYRKGTDVKVLADVKCIFDKKTLQKAGFLYWSL